MTYREALAQAYPRPWWRKLGRAVINTCHALLLGAVITVPGALMDLYNQGVL